jgi:hypothetical protein
VGAPLLVPFLLLILAILAVVAIIWLLRRRNRSV